MIVTAHQPNYLPGLSVIDKVRAADAVIWLDEVQYSHGGWSNRNRMPDGSWLTIPILRSTDMGPFNQVKLSPHREWRRTHIRTIRQHYGDLETVFDEIKRPYGLLIGLNLSLLRIILHDGPPWHFQSHLDGGRPVVVDSESAVALRPISRRLAMMTAELGGTTYLSGPSGFRYLDEQPFRDLGIQVRYWDHHGANSCCLQQLVAA